MRRFKCQRIAQKITLGYALTIGIAIAGTSAGLGVGALFETQAALERDTAAQQAEWVFRLSNRTSPLALLYPQQLLGIANKPIWLRYKVSQAQNDISTLRLFITEFEGFIEENQSQQGISQGMTIVRPLREFLDQYELWLEDVWQSIRSMPSESDVETGELTSRIKQDRLLLLQQQLDNPESEALQVEMGRLARRLGHLGEAAAMQERRALAGFRDAQNLRVSIVVIGLVGSAALAILCAIVISRAIARPIRDLTSQTRRITDEENFDRRVSIDTEDETAQLATSIDQLVRWAGQYTRELELAQDTLEQRVESRTRELRTAQAQVIQSEKMSSLGQLVAGVAHEINNPVGFIYSNVNHATEYVRDLLDVIEVYRNEHEETEAIAEKLEEVDLPFLEEDVMKMLRSMKGGADRIKQIVLSLRTFSRLDEADLKFADLHQGLDSTLTILEHRLKGTGERPAINVVQDYGTLPLVNCFAGEMNQVFMNLIINAVDALEEAMAQSNAKAASPADFIPEIVIKTHVEGERCLISFRDNGPGICASVRDRLFDPFVTTKAVGKGTGMGLAVSYQIVTDKHYGRLTCRSQPGLGSTFEIEIPVDVAVAALGHGEKLVS
ncbi:MAG: ATP-binding protein [Cyanobacteria bacterium P01_C01_bin.89]